MSDGLVPLISVFSISIICVQPSIGLTIFSYSLPYLNLTSSLRFDTVTNE